jgi:hypothetical protein
MAEVRSRNRNRDRDQAAASASASVLSVVGEPTHSNSEKDNTSVTALRMASPRHPMSNSPSMKADDERRRESDDE